jgi:phosphoglycerate kinase
MGAEVAALRRMVDRPEQPYVAVVGGAKISTKTAPLAALLERVEVLLIGGGMANTMLVAQGRSVGRSLVEQEMLETASSVLRRAKERGVRLELPSAVVVADAIASPTRVAVVAADAVPADMMIVDIGPASQKRFAAAIAGARTVFWNGPMGVFETAEFAAGTMAVARALASAKAFTVVGGGESVMAVHRAGVAGAIGHVSTGGGASLQYLTGEVLPAIAALEA